MTTPGDSLMAPAGSIENNPLVDDVNVEHQARLSQTEKICRRIADATGAPVALLLAIVVQMIWIAVGAATHWDPFPFVFLLTVSNVLQLILIFVIAVAQKQQTLHDELRAEADHDSISRLLYHDQLQNELLLRLAKSAKVDVSDLQKQAYNLATSPD
ncbi:MAG TPA: DUF1003 domain-containing protein [Candidatus Cybelea sp.]|jgi:uncharacterized membrane protein|nr:DUF1003 domain-containing protein [Candidatus Cybelea sp.]